MSEAVPEPRPLKRQPALLAVSCVVFAIWVAFLVWIYFQQLHAAVK